MKASLVVEPDRAGASPFWTLFRAELGRCWDRRKLKRALLFLAVVVAVQGVVSYAFPGFSLDGGSKSKVFRILGLRSSLWTGLLESRSGRHVFGYGPVFLRYEQVMSLLSVALAAARFLMPAYAATAIASGRRVSQPFLPAELTPGRFLIAKGLAVVFPFALLMAAGMAFAAVASLAPPPQGLPGSDPLDADTLDKVPRVLVAAPITLLATAGIFVCISVLCREARQAVALCYGVQLLALPILSDWLIHSTPRRLLGPFFYNHPPLSWVYPYGVTALLASVALAALLPAALAALSRAWEAGSLDGPAAEAGAGVVVGEVKPNTLAERAGLRVRDVILAVDGAPVANLEDLIREIAAREASPALQLSIRREGVSRSVAVSLSERSEQESGSAL